MDSHEDPAEAQALYDELTDDLLYDPLVSRSTMMGYPCLRHQGRFFGSYSTRDEALVVKLPRERVAEVVASGSGEPFAPAGKVFREWVLLPTPDRAFWRSMLEEAVDFARTAT